MLDVCCAGVHHFDHHFPGDVFRCDRTSHWSEDNVADHVHVGQHLALLAALPRQHMVGVLPPLLKGQGVICFTMCVMRIFLFCFKSDWWMVGCVECEML